MLEKKVKRCPFIDICEKEVGLDYFNSYCSLTTRTQYGYELCIHYQRLKDLMVKHKQPKEWDKEKK